MEKTSQGLVIWAKSKIGCPYWYGTFGQKGTSSLLNAKIKQYPSYYNNSRINRCKKQYGEQVFDCVGLIKGYIWYNEKDKIIYNSKQDVSAGGMLSKCKIKGKISTLPEEPGILLFMRGHVGIYIGKGYAIEATVGKSEYTVKRTLVAGRGWTHWGKCPYINYDNTTKTALSATTSKTKYLSCKGKYNGPSIVDALKSIGVDSKFAYRKKIANKNGIKIYLSSATQNIKLLGLLKTGKCIKP